MDLTPRERLLEVFAAPAGEAPLRGCPFHNAAVEMADTLPAVREIVARHKQAFADLLTETAREAGAADPEVLGRQLAVLFEEAEAPATSLNDPRPVSGARAAAVTLIDAALSRAGRSGVA
ncbi:hypothetical protein AB0L59_25985 [Streptomyces sp. NPDC052109]|uniref:TetR family transcriptional regulator C-terminal domain-containing protein n=1 Tax=Streptomyces sp. NPDC052109 TaxID=3155527 RepID=UPI00344ABFC7